MGTLILGALSSVATARALGVAGKGVLSLLVTLFSQVSYVAILGIDVALLTLIAAEPRRSGWIVRWANRRVFLLGIAGGAALLLFGFGIYRSQLASIPKWYLAGLAACIPLALSAQCAHATLRAIGRQAEANAYVLTQAFVLGACIVLPSVIFQSARACVAGFVVAQANSYILVVGLRRRYVRDRRVSRSPERHAWSFALRTHLGTIVQNANYRLDALIVGAILPVTAVGRYSVAVSVAEALWILPAVFGPLVVQRAAASPEEGLQFTLRSMRLTGGAIGLLVVLLAVVGRQLISAVFGAQYAASNGALLALLPGAWALGLWKILINYFVGIGNLRARTKSALLALLTTIVLDLLLIPRFGIVGAGVASSVAYVVALFSALWFFDQLGVERWQSALLLRRSDFSRAAHQLAGLRDARNRRRDRAP